MSPSSISRCLVPEKGKLESVCHATLTWIDNVHQVASIPRIPILYYPELFPFGRYVPGDGRPEHIELSLVGPYPHLTLAHEIGHLLDQAIVSYNGYASADNRSPLSEVLDTIRQSVAFEALQSIALSTDVSFAQQFARRRAVYWSGAEELWARAYAQYIAIRSKSSALQEDIAHAKSLETHAASFYVQWEEDDFLLISTAIDAAFATLGWLYYER